MWPLIGTLPTRITRTASKQVPSSITATIVLALPCRRVMREVFAGMSAEGRMTAITHFAAKKLCLILASDRRLGCIALFPLTFDSLVDLVGIVSRVNVIENQIVGIPIVANLAATTQSNGVY